ncbi:10935_t:CDS:10, partial [Ambispora leptoticha]
KDRPFKQRDFTGWQESLDPEKLTLLSLLSFRRKKSDFSFSVCEEHFAIAKFLESIPEIVTDKKWILDADRIDVKASKFIYYMGEEIGKESDYVSMQPPKRPDGPSTSWASYGVRLRWAPSPVFPHLSSLSMPWATQAEEVKAFWIQVDIEKIETGKKLKEYEIELGKAEFAANSFKMGNEVHKIQEQVRIDYVLNSHANTSQGKNHESDKVSGKKRAFASFDDNPFVTPKYVYSTKRKREGALNAGTQNFKMKFLGIDSTDEGGSGSESDNEDEEYEDKEGSDNEIIASDSVFDDSFSLKDSEWKLKNGELVTAALARGTMKVLKESKENAKKPDAYIMSVIRLGLSGIVDLTSEFTNGMWTFFGEDWDILKAKMCNNGKYWEAREFIYDEMKNPSSVKYHQILKIYFNILEMFLKNPYVFVCEDGQTEKPTEMEYVVRMIAPTLDIVFSDVTQIICLRWGETVFKTASACRKIDLKVVCHGRNLELSHSECARTTIPSKAVRDRSKCLRTNQCILNEFLRQDISEDDAENSVIFGLQFAALCGQLIGVELVDDGLYFGIEGDSFRFPSQLTQMKLLRHALEVIYFFKDNILRKAEALAKDNHPYKKIFNSRKPKPKHRKLAFIRSPDFTSRQKSKNTN